MSSDVDLLGVINHLQSDSILYGLIDAAPPQAIVMPFARCPEKSYLFVAVFFREDVLSKKAALEACRRVVALLKQEYLGSLDGLEVLVSVVVGQRTERVLRLSVFKDSLDVFERMDDAELDVRAPAVGITNLVYKQIS